jgi:succinyl-CoA synthetase beta subunit
MKLIEADAKSLLARYGISVPRGQLFVAEQADYGKWPAGAAVKAQVFVGGRGLAGLVRLVEADDVAATARAIQAVLTARREPPVVLVEEKQAIAAEFYLGLRIDDVAQRPVLMFSASGGVEIERRAESLRTLLLDPVGPTAAFTLIGFFREAGVEGRLVGALARFTADLISVLRAEDAEMIEINPLAVTPGGKLVALDAKVVLDGEAAYRRRHRDQLLSHDLAEAAGDDSEAQAARRGFTFVDLPGEIAVVSGGAGLGMLVLDTLQDAGFTPANFTDTISGSGAEQFRAMTEFVFDHAEQSRVRAIFAYFTLSATSLKALSDGLLSLLRTRRPPKPMVIGIHASGPAVAERSLEAAFELLRAEGLQCDVELEEVVARLKATLCEPTKLQGGSPSDPDDQDRG